MTVRSFARHALGVFAAATLAAGLTGCGSSTPKMPDLGAADADKYLFDHGSSELAKRHWLAAREYFKRLVDSYPTSQYRQDGKLGIGDSYLGENSAESKVMAENEFREFLQFYPTSPRADYAQFNIAVSHYRQMLGAERDQTETNTTITQFNLFFERYPESKLTAQAETLYRNARDRFDDSEFTKGFFYYRVKYYPGALGRFLPIVHDDPEYTRRDQLFYYVAEAMHASNRNAEALPFYDRVVQEFKSSKYLQKSKDRIAEISKAKATSPAK
jgi:outer membrane protein assembly factor BamD